MSTRFVVTEISLHDTIRKIKIGMKGTIANIHYQTCEGKKLYNVYLDNYGHYMLTEYQIKLIEGDVL